MLTTGRKKPEEKGIRNHRSDENKNKWNDIKVNLVEMRKSMAKEKKKTKKKGKAKKIILIILVILAVIIFIAIRSASKMASGIAVVTTTKATVGDLQGSISTSGSVESEDKKVYFSQVAGKIDSINVEAGQAVQAGDLLIGYAMDDMESMKTQAGLQQKRSDAVYNGALADNSNNQSKLNEANVNLDVLNQQIEDWTAHLKDLQRQLEDAQRNTSNSLAGENYNINTQISDVQKRMEDINAQLSGLNPEEEGAEQKKAELTAQLEELQKQLDGLQGQLGYNQYAQTVAGSGDEIVNLQREIEKVQEELNDFLEYKAKMESQKSSSEMTVMDQYDRTTYEVDNQLAQLSYEDAVSDYDIASQGIRAQFNGIVTECVAVEGATVLEGTQLLTLESSDNVKIVFQATKNDLKKLELGQKADVTISGKDYEGEISKINRMATPNASGTPMVNVEVHIKNPDDNIILGLDAKLYIYTEQAEGVLMVPAEAINADKEGDFLYVVENNLVVRKPVVCGISADDYVEIVEGITENDEIIVSSMGDLEEGKTVAVMPEAQ